MKKIIALYFVIFYLVCIDTFGGEIDVIVDKIINIQSAEKRQFQDIISINSLSEELQNKLINKVPLLLHNDYFRKIKKEKNDYLKNEELINYEIVYQEKSNQWIYNRSKAVVVGDDLIYVVGLDGNIYVHPEQIGGTERKFYHSCFFRSGPVLGAGHLMFQNGILTGLNSHSGHYHPQLEHLSQTVDIFKDKMRKTGPDFLSSIVVEGYDGSRFNISDLNKLDLNKIEKDLDRINKILSPSVLTSCSSPETSSSHGISFTPVTRMLPFGKSSGKKSSSDKPAMTFPQPSDSSAK